MTTVWIAGSIPGSSPGTAMTTVGLLPISLRRHELGGLERLAHFFFVLLHAREGLRHVLAAAVPQLDRNQRIGPGDGMGRPGLRPLGGQQVEAPSPIDRFSR